LNPATINQAHGWWTDNAGSARKAADQRISGERGWVTRAAGMTSALCAKSAPRSTSAAGANK
jgi:hypothetical protein